MSVSSVSHGTLDMSTGPGYDTIAVDDLPVATGIYVLALDLTNSALGDTFEVYIEQHIGATSLVQPTYVIYGGQSSDIFYTMPIVAKDVSTDVFPTIQVYQNTGTNRTIKWEILKVGDCVHMGGGSLLIPYASPTGHEVYASASGGAYVMNYAFTSGVTNDVAELKIQTKWTDITSYTDTKKIVQQLRDGYYVQNTGCIVTPSAFRVEAGIPEYNVANTWYLYWDVFKIGV